MGWSLAIIRRLSQPDSMLRTLSALSPFLSLCYLESQDLPIDHSVKVEFSTQAGYDYPVYSATDQIYHVCVDGYDPFQYGVFELQCAQGPDGQGW